jgi:hypothetical protein
MSDKSGAASNLSPKKQRLQRNSPNKGVLEEISEMKSSIHQILTELAPLKTLQDLKAQLTAVNDQLIRITLENKKLDEIVLEQSGTIAALKSRINGLEQYTRGDSVEILGVPEVPGEDCTDVVLAIAEGCGLNLSVSDISVAHRTPNNQDKSRKILVKFVRRAHKGIFLNSAKKKRPSVADLNRVYRSKRVPEIKTGNTGKCNIYINEHLTSENRGILIKALACKHKHGLWSVWTDNGITRLRKIEGGVIMSFISEEQIDAFTRSLEDDEDDE